MQVSSLHCSAAKGYYIIKIFRCLVLNGFFKKTIISKQVVLGTVLENTFQRRFPRELVKTELCWIDPSLFLNEA